MISFYDILQCRSFSLGFCHGLHRFTRICTDYFHSFLAEKPKAERICDVKTSRYLESMLKQAGNHSAFYTLHPDY